MLGADPFLALVLLLTLLSLFANVLLTVDSVVLFFCLRGVLPDPYSTSNILTMKFQWLINIYLDKNM